MLAGFAYYSLFVYLCWVFVSCIFICENVVSCFIHAFLFGLSSVLLFSNSLFRCCSCSLLLMCVSLACVYSSLQVSLVWGVFVGCSLVLAFFSVFRFLPVFACCFLFIDSLCRGESSICLFSDYVTVLSSRALFWRYCSTSRSLSSCPCRIPRPRPLFFVLYSFLFVMVSRCFVFLIVFPVLIFAFLCS